MKALCPCVKTQGDHHIPDPNCKHCQGSGFFEVSFPAKDITEAFWAGICPTCHQASAWCFQGKGEPPPAEDPDIDLPECVDEDCPNFRQAGHWVLSTMPKLPRK